MAERLTSRLASDHVVAGLRDMAHCKTVDSKLVAASTAAIRSSRELLQRVRLGTPLPGFELP